MFKSNELLLSILVLDVGVFLDTGFVVDLLTEVGVGLDSLP